MRRFIEGTIGLTLLFVGASAMCAPRVLTELADAPRVSFPVPPPTPFLAAIVDTATLSRLPDLGAKGLAEGGRGAAADVHGHRAFLTAFDASGSAIAVIDTRLNVVEAVVGVAPLYPPRLATDPVRPRLYIAASSPQSEIAVLDTGSLTLLPTITLPAGLPTDQGISDPIVAPDGTRLFVVVGNVLLSVQLPDGQIVQSAKLDFAPSSLALNQQRNELYVGDANGRGVFVLAADTLVVQRSVSGFSEIYSLALRPADGALLVESNANDDSPFFSTRVDAVDVVTDEPLATSTGTGSGLVVSIDGTQAYRLQRGTFSVNGPYSDTSDRLLVLDASTLGQLATIPLDNRAQDDPTRNLIAIVATSAVSIPNVAVAVEYFDAALGHYFTTSIPAEIAALDGGMFPGWQRTGETLPVYAQGADGPDGTTPVCRFYGLPEKGLNSHFYSASPFECAAVQEKWGDSWLLESSDVFDVYPADAVTGACPFETTPVYRVYNNRPDANHRYTTSVAIRDSMVQAGWIPEGYGPNAVAFCVPR